jgi:hypothetical protein
MLEEEWMAPSRGGLPPPVPPPLGFEVADDLSNSGSAPEEHKEAIASQHRPSRIIVNDELFGLEFTLEVTQAGREAVVHERCGIAISNYTTTKQILAEAETEAKEAQQRSLSMYYGPWVTAAVWL